jgi:predicted AAA+ superfamily ATPase
MTDENTRQREVKALLKLSGTYVLERLEIVTWDEETLIHEKDTVIQVIPVWKWLLTV